MTGAGDGDAYGCGYGQSVVGDGYPAGVGWVVVARGELDQDTLVPLEEALTAAAGLHPLVVLDAGSITFGDSSFLNLLLRLHHLTTLRIAAPGEQLRRLFAVTGADTVLSLHTSVEAAVGS